MIPVMSQIRTNIADIDFRHQCFLTGVIGLGLLMCPFMPTAALSGDIAEDPSGFYGIIWGAPLGDVPGLSQVESGEHIQAYEFKHGPPKVGEATVASMRFIAFDGQFARVMIRYEGTQTHYQILPHLESLFGPIDRIPGSMIRGLNQQFTWRGTQTEVNLTYDGGQERGAIFIESRTLAPRFTDSVPE